jgi:hypothetical protein
MNQNIVGARKQVEKMKEIPLSLKITLRKPFIDIE